MTDLERRMREDRAVRDAAKALVSADIAYVKSSMSAKTIGERVLDSVGEGAKDVVEQAADAAENNRGVFAVLIGAVVLWFARNPIMSLFDDDKADTTGA